jgi:hypothetical protein
MKFNWKAALAVVVIVGVLFWGVSSLLSKSYSGRNLTFGIGHGTVALTNPADEPVTVQLVSPGSRTFTVATSIEDVSGSSERIGEGRESSQLFEFVAPPGLTEFSVARGTNVSFVGAEEANLSAVVQPASESEANTIMALTAIVILGALYYISRTMRHQWLKNIIARIRPEPVVAIPVAVPAPEVSSRWVQPASKS